MTSTPIYQSPIELQYCDTLKIEQCIELSGKNRGAVYNSDAQIFEVKDKIVLKINNKYYKLDEYHFHMRGEHKVNNKLYPAEIHYVFIEFDPETQSQSKRKQH